LKLITEGEKALWKEGSGNLARQLSDTSEPNPQSRSSLNDGPSDGVVDGCRDRWILQVGIERPWKPILRQRRRTQREGLKPIRTVPSRSRNQAYSLPRQPPADERETGTILRSP